MTKGNKKGHAGLIIFILILILAIGGGTGFYFYQRQQPRKAVEHFLDSMKKMDFDTMESLIQSSDLTAVDNADIRDAALTELIFIKQLSLNFSVRSFPTLMPETSLQKKRHRQNLLLF